MPCERPDLQVLGRAECLRLLASVPIGRIAFTVDAMPAVQPVAFVLHDGQVVIRTRQGSKLVAGTRDSIVAFEADSYEPASHTGWSVTVVGPATTASNPQLVERLATLPLRPWAPQGQENFVLISIMVVHGRRLTAPGEAACG